MLKGSANSSVNSSTKLLGVLFGDGFNATAVDDDEVTIIVMMMVEGLMN